MKFARFVLMSVCLAPGLFSAGGCSSATDEKQPKVQGGIDARLKDGPIGRKPIGASGGKSGGGGSTSGGLSKN